VEVNQEQIDAIVRNPSESLNVEIKRWIDSDSPEGAAKIVKGCLALRNYNGGYFVIGFDDKTLQPDLGNQPSNPRVLFHTDKIQGLVSKHTQELFEIKVSFSSRDGIDYPVIIVPHGVQVPVAAKKPLSDNSNKILVKLGDVYFRTLSANGRPSTSPARPEDWREILDICFENREANIGRFLRRHLTGLDQTNLIDALRQFGILATAPTPPTLRDESIKFLRAGEKQFSLALNKRPLKAPYDAMLNMLTWHVALVTDPEWKGAVANASFLAKVLASNPNYTGWPTWLDSRTFDDAQSRPYSLHGAWETFLASLGFSPHLDFMRFEPSGRFYQRRILQDDLTDRVTPGTALDPLLVILRVAEAIAVGIAMVRSLLGSDEPPRQLGFAFLWTGLSGRELISWANPMMLMVPTHAAHENEMITFIDLPSDTPVSSIAPLVDEATRELFALFGGTRITYSVIEDLIVRMVERRLP